MRMRTSAAKGHALQFIIVRSLILRIARAAPRICGSVTTCFDSFGLSLSITPVLQHFANFFLDIISFLHVLYFDVGRSQIEWNLRVKTEMSACTAIMLNDHSNLCIERIY